VGLLELFEIAANGRLTSAVFRARLTDAEREAGPVKVEFGAPVEVKNPMFTYGAAPAATDPEPDEDQQWLLDPDVDFAATDTAIGLTPTSSTDDDDEDDDEQDDGYPTDAELDALSRFEGTPRQFFAEVHRLWSYQDFVAETPITDEFGRPQIEVNLVTGGWSGNESVAGAIGDTMVELLWWYMSQRGGLSVYRVPAALYDTAYTFGMRPATGVS